MQRLTQLCALLCAIAVFIQVTPSAMGDETDQRPSGNDPSNIQKSVATPKQDTIGHFEKEVNDTTKEHNPMSVHDSSSSDTNGRAVSKMNKTSSTTQLLSPVPDHGSGTRNQESEYLPRDFGGNLLPVWDDQKALCPLFQAYAAYDCPRDIQAWKCAWCRKTTTLANSSSCGPLMHVALVENPETDIFAYLGYRPETQSVVVVFRGVMPDSERNRITSMKITLVPFTEKRTSAKVHSGFVDAYMSIRKDLFQAIKEILKKLPSEKHNLQIIGHGMGGALATIAAPDIMQLVVLVNNKMTEDLKDKFISPDALTLWTFGAPAVGNKDWAESHNLAFQAYGAVSWRVRNLEDFLPLMIPEGLVGAPTIESATNDGRDAMLEFNLYPLQFDADVGYMHTGTEVVWSSMQSPQLVQDYYNFTVSSMDALLNIVNGNMGAAFGSVQPVRPAPSLQGRFECGPVGNSNFTTLYGSCRGHLNPSQCADHGLVNIWPVYGDADIFQDGSRQYAPTTLAWGVCMINWSGLGGGRWAGRDSHGARIQGGGMPCTLNHEQYFGYDMEACIAPAKPFCERYMPSPETAADIFVAMAN